MFNISALCWAERLLPHAWMFCNKRGLNMLFFSIKVKFICVYFLSEPLNLTSNIFLRIWICSGLIKAQYVTLN